MAHAKLGGCVARGRVYVSDQDDPGRRVIIPDVRVVSHENWPLEPWTPAYADWAHPCCRTDEAIKRDRSFLSY